MLSCPCHSHKPFSQCCEPYLLNKEFAPTPEVLMRSRFSAYTLGNFEYIVTTMRGKPLKEFNEEEARSSHQHIQWGELKILDAPSVADDVDEGFVEFITSYIFQGQNHTLHERSRFVKRKGKWFYVNGQILS